MKTLSELKKTTLKSYIKKASEDIGLQGYIRGSSRSKSSALDHHMTDRALRKQDNREKGIERAVEKLEEGSEVWALPTVLILRRKTIRNFSDGTQVALYYNDKLDKYFSIPFREPIVGHDDPITVSESHELSNFQTLLEAQKQQTSAQILQLDGTEFSIEAEDVNQLIALYEHLTDDNKVQFLTHLHEQERVAQMLSCLDTE